jgi:hypothetical protein
VFGLRLRLGLGLESGQRHRPGVLDRKRRQVLGEVTPRDDGAAAEAWARRGRVRTGHIVRRHLVLEQCRSAAMRAHRRSVATAWRLKCAKWPKPEPRACHWGLTDWGVPECVD